MADITEDTATPVAANTANTTTGVIDKIMGDGKRFGFIKPDGAEKNLFFHADKMVDKAAFDTLKAGDKVSFDTELDNQGRTNAINVAIVTAPATVA